MNDEYEYKYEAPNAYKIFFEAFLMFFDFAALIVIFTYIAAIILTIISFN